GGQRPRPAVHGARGQGRHGDDGRTDAPRSTSATGTRRASGAREARLTDRGQADGSAINSARVGPSTSGVDSGMRSRTHAAPMRSTWNAHDSQTSVANTAAKPPNPLSAPTRRGAMKTNSWVSAARINPATSAGGASARHGTFMFGTSL